MFLFVEMGGGWTDYNNICLLSFINGLYITYIYMVYIYIYREDLAWGQVTARGFTTDMITLLVGRTGWRKNIYSKDFKSLWLIGGQSQCGWQNEKGWPGQGTTHCRRVPKQSSGRAWWRCWLSGFEWVFQAARARACGCGTSASAKRVWSSWRVRPAGPARKKSGCWDKKKDGVGSRLFGSRYGKNRNDLPWGNGCGGWKKTTYLLPFSVGQTKS